MAGSTIQLTTQINLDDSQFKSGIKGVETTLKKLSTAKAFVGLSLDDTNFRTKYQSVIKDSIASIRKAYGAKKGEEVTYRNAKGNSTKIDTIGSMQTAYKYALSQSADNKLSAVDKNKWKERSDAIAIYLNLLKQIGQETRNVAKSEKELAEMPFRKERARRSAEVYMEKRRAIQEELAPEKAEKAADKRFRREAMEKMKQSGYFSIDEEARANLIAQERAEKEIADRRRAIRVAEAKAAYQEQQRQEREQMKFNKAVFDAAVKRRREQKKLSDAELRIEQQIAKERSRNVRGGGNSAASILRQIELYHKLEAAAKKAGNAQLTAYSRNQIVALNKQLNALGGLTSAYRQQGDIFRGLTGLAARYFSIYTIANFARKVAETTGYFQQQQVALEGILGSASAAREVLGDIKAFALQSPFQTKELVQFTKQLSAFGLKKNELFPTVKSLADISAGLGVDMSRIILAYGQVKSAAVLRGQELRQFTEAGIPMVDRLAKKFTELNGKLVTTGEVFKLISERRVPFEMVASVLNDMTNEGGQFYKMQENLTDTLYGQLQKLRDMWTLAMDRIGKGADGFIINVVKGLQILIERGKELTHALLGAFIVSRIAKFKNHAEGLARLMRIIVKTTGVWGAVATVATGVLIGVISSLIEKHRRLKRAMDEVADGYSKDTKKMEDGLDSLSKKITSANVGTKKFADAVSTLASNYSDFVSPEFISALQGQGKEAEKAADAFIEYADAIKEAIRQQNNYLSLVGQGDVAAEEASKNTKQLMEKGFHWGGGLDILQRGYKKSTNGGLADIRDISGVSQFLNTNNITRDAFISMLQTIAGTALVDAANEGITLDNKEGLRKKFAKSITDTWRDFNEETALEIAENIRLAIDKESYKKALDSYTGAKSTTYYKIDKPFQDAAKDIQNGNYERTFGNVIDDKISKEQDTADIWRDALKLSLENAKLNGYANSNLEKVVNDTSKSAYDIYVEFENFKKGLNATELSLLNRVYKNFSENMPVRSGHSLRIANAFAEQGGLFYDWRKNENLKNIVSSYGTPTDSDFEQKRNDLQKHISDLSAKIDEYKRIPGGVGKYANDLAIAEEQLRALRVLQGGEYYGIPDKNTGSGRNRYERVRMNEFITDLLKLITDADEQVKKIVKVEGYTGELNEFVKNLGDDNITKEFFKRGGKPFEKLFNDLEKYGIDEKLMPNFNADLLTNIFRDAGWEEGKPLSIPDFEQMYQSVLDNISSSVLPEIKKRRESLQKGTSEYNSLEGIETRLEKQLITWRTEKIRIFGGEEIDRKLEDMLRSLTKIELNTEYENELRNTYERTKGLVGFREAYGAMFDKNYEVYNPVLDKQGTLRELLEQKAYAGVMQTKVGDVLDSVSKSANLNIHNLYQILDAIRTLKTNALRQEVLNNDKSLDAGQFERINQQLIKALSETAKAIEENTKAIHASMTPSEQKGIEIDNKREQYLKDLDAIISEEERGAIDSEKAISRSIEAFKKYMDEIAKTLGVQGNLPAVREGTWMSTDMQNFLGGMSGQSSFVDQVGRKITEAVANNQMSGKDASEIMSGLNSTIASIDLIIKYIYNAINSFIKIGRSMIRLIKSNNPVVGRRYDEYGNVTYEKAFDETSIEKAEKSFDLIQEWNQHEMDGWEKFKSGDILGSITEFITKFFDLISSINDIVDLDTKRAIEELTRSNKNLQKTIDKMNWELNYLAGSDKINATGNIIGVLLKQYENYQEMRDKELNSKTPDLDAVDEYEDGAENARRTAIDMVQNIRTEIAGTADELAETLTDAFVSAFKNGENAARSWRDAVNNYVGDVLKKILLTEVLGPQVQEVIDRWMGGTSEQIKNKVGEDGKIHIGDKTYTIYEYYRSRFTDEKNGKLAQGELNALGTTMNDFFASLPEWTRNMIAWNDSASSLSGGIQGITEDTARTLEGLGNSILTQHVLSNKYLETITLLPIANIQTSWFEGMLAAQRQAAQAARNIETSINELRTGSSQPLHVIMS